MPASLWRCEGSQWHSHMVRALLAVLAPIVLMRLHCHQSTTQQQSLLNRRSQCQHRSVYLYCRSASYLPAVCLPADLPAGRLASAFLPCSLLHCCSNAGQPASHWTLASLAASLLMQAMRGSYLHTRIYHIYTMQIGCQLLRRCSTRGDLRCAGGSA